MFIMLAEKLFRIQPGTSLHNQIKPTVQIYHLNADNLMSEKMNKLLNGNLTVSYVPSRATMKSIVKNGGKEYTW